MTIAVDWHSQSDFPQHRDSIAGYHTLCCQTKRDFFRENIAFQTIQVLPFLLRLNEGSNMYHCGEYFCDVDICPLTAMAVLYI